MTRPLYKQARSYGGVLNELFLMDRELGTVCGCVCECVCVSVYKVLFALLGWLV